MKACPHCGAVARFEPSTSLRWRCGVCGGAVVPVEGEGARSYPELADLVVGQRLRAMAVGWMAAGIVLAIVALMTGGLAMLAWLASHGAALVLGVVAAMAGAGAAVGLRRAGRRNAEARDRIDQAWEKVAAQTATKAYDR